MAKKKSPEKQFSSLLDELRQEYISWQIYHDKGGSDPFWPDGTNMNLIRNHILYFKSEIKDHCESYGFSLPEEIAWPIPPEVPNNYIARSEEIREHAAETLRQYKEDPDYQYLCQNQSQITQNARKKICLPAILGYVSGLETAIEKDDLIVMRRHEDSSRYLGCFSDAAKNLKKEILNAEREDFQFSLF